MTSVRRYEAQVCGTLAGRFWEANMYPEAGLPPVYLD